MLGLTCRPLVLLLTLLLPACGGTIAAASGLPPEADAGSVPDSAALPEATPSLPPACTTGAPAQAVTPLDQPAAGELAVDADNVYFIYGASGAGTLMKAPKRGGAATALAPL